MTENVLIFLSFFTIIAFFLTALNAWEKRNEKSTDEADDKSVMDIIDVVTQCSCPKACPRCGEPVTTITCPDEHWHRVECQHCHLSMMTHSKEENECA